MKAAPCLKKEKIKGGKKEEASSAQSKGGTLKRTFGVMSSSATVKNRNAHLFRTPEKLSSQVQNASCVERAARALTPIELDMLPRSPSGLKNSRTTSSPLSQEIPLGTPGKQEGTLLNSTFQGNNGIICPPLNAPRRIQRLIKLNIRQPFPKSGGT